MSPENNPKAKAAAARPSVPLYVVLLSQAPGRFEDNAVLLEAEKCETESDQIRAVGGDRRARGRKCQRRIMIDDN